MAADRCPVGATFDYERDRCGRRYPSVVGREPRLRLSFDDCARRAVRRYRRLAAPASFPESPVGTAAVVRRACPGLACGRWGDATAGGPDAPADGSDRDAPGGARPGCRAEAPSGA
ncbi:hypothetical protein BRC94_10330 [Halobacteriales archaeon QS_5_70_17]|nr:MAG: hypothetical protein BRC94_10330 [Halobacteriales archaeon QS_5_70_17]